MTARPTPAPRSKALEAVQTTVGDAGYDAIATYDFSIILPQNPCPRCGSPGTHRVSPGTPPHHQRVGYGQYGRWLRRLPRPRPVALEGGV